jgi:2-polyprenyl-3-methyl-5-hydroxy-6-metoxy-1,4-benzoquinol methylase
MTNTLQARYGLKTDQYSSHRQIANWLKLYKARAIPDRPCVVYDIGCAQGLIGQLLPPAEFILFGIDADPVAIRQAALLYRQVVLADIEAQMPAKFSDPPDVMVLADVLEHTRNPTDCLKNLCRAYLDPRARVIISLPNIAHLYIRLSLLTERFEYTDRGLLDRTHLRFFTMASALKMIRECKIDVERVATTPAPLPLVNPLFAEGRLLWPFHQLNAALAGIFKTLLGYQIIVYGVFQP